MLLNLLQELVNRALRFEEIMSGSISGLAHVEVKVEDLQSMVMHVLVCSIVFLGKEMLISSWHLP